MIDFQDIKPATWVIFISLSVLIGGILYLGYSSKGGIKPIHWIAITVIIGGVAALYKETKSSETNQSILNTGVETNAVVKALRLENKELKNKLIENQVILTAQSQSLEILSKENDRLSIKASEIHTQTDSIHAQTTNIQSNITGGDSYCILLISYESNNKPKFLLEHKGETVLRNVHISISDYARRLSLREKLAKNDYWSAAAKEISAKTEYVFNFNVVYPHTITDLSIPVEEDQANLGMNIKILFESKVFEEELDVKNFKYETRISTIKLERNGKTVERH